MHTSGLREGVQIVKLHVPAGVGAGVANTVNQDYFPVPVAMSLLGAKCMASAVGGTTPTLDLFSGSSTILSAPTSIALANTVYSSALASGTQNLANPVAMTKLAAGSKLSLRAVTQAGVGSISTPAMSVMLEFDDPRYAKDYFIHRFSLPGDTGLSNNVAETTIQDHWVVPEDCEWVYGCCIGRATAGTEHKPQITIYNGATEITSNVTLAADDTVYDILPSGAVTGLGMYTRGYHLTKGTVLSMRVKTAATAGAVKTPAATLLFRRVTR